MTEPLISVILIGYNDAGRIVRALDSIRQQTLRSIEIIVVDDASVDATVEIVSGVAEIDPRVRVIRRTENSGGCSAPRNDGLRAAKAPWVMFCDSDDEYERHACANLLTAAENWDADVVCGMAVRHDVRKDSDRPWRPELHARDRLVDSLEAEPELLYDTISVNKIYRRSMLVENRIEFPPGVLFEDQVFTLRSFLAARRIGILSVAVYIWNVDRAAEELSITQGRMQARNVIDRVTVNQQMDEVLASSSSDLRLAKAIKFLRHEGYLYLWAIAENPDHDAAQGAAEVFRSYVQGIDVNAFDHIRPALRVAMFGLLTSDMDLLQQAMRWERWASVVDSRIVRIDGNQYWLPPDEREALGRNSAYWLDVSRLHLLDMPFSTRRYFHELIELRVHRNRVEAAIRSRDFAGDLDESTSADLVWSDKSGAVIASLPLELVMRDAESRIVWRGSGTPSVHIDRALMKPDKGAVSVRLSHRGFVNTTAIRSVQIDVTRVFVPLPAIAFADRPAGAMFVAGERSSVAWRPGGLSRGPAAWSRRIGKAAQRRLTSSATKGGSRVRNALLPGEFDLPTDRPVVAYIPAPSAAGPRPTWPLDLTAWEKYLADDCYLLVHGDVTESVPTRLWGAIRDARDQQLGWVIEHSTLIVTDDPALIDMVGRSIVFRPDEGAARYLLPVLPPGYPVLDTIEDLSHEVHSVLAVLAVRGELS